MPDPFLACLKENVAELKGFGKKRVEAAGEAYARIRDSRVALGEDPIAAGYMAMDRVIDDINNEILRKQSALRHNVTVMADAERRLDYAMERVTTVGGMETKVGMALRSFNENVPSVENAPSLISEEARLGGLYTGMLAREAPLSTLRRKFGRKPLKEQQRDFVREVVEGLGASGNTDAKNAAKIFHDVMTMAYASMRKYGVRVREYGPNDQMPINIQPAKLLRGKGALAQSFVSDMNQHIDWSIMEWPDGRRILPVEREMFLKAAQNGIVSGGIKTGFVKELGEDLEKAFLRDVVDERLFRFKNGASWQAIHDKYGDGDAFGTLQTVLTHVIREEAKARIYGPDADRMVATIAALGQSKVVDKQIAGDMAATKAMAGLNGRISQFHKEATVALRSNPMTNNMSAITVGAAANMISAAQLGSAIVANTMGDAVNIATLTMAENRGIHSLVRTMAEYIKGQIPGRAYPTLMDAQRSGYMIDDLVFNDIQTTRFNMLTTVAPTWTKAWGRFWTVAGGVPRHTNLLRAAVNRGFLIDMAEWRSRQLGDLPEATQKMMANAGIDAASWERIRTDMAILEPRKGVQEYDTIQSYATLPRELAERMHRMQINEVNGQVLLPTNEASVIMRGTTRPDTAIGAVLSSFSMYTAQPLAASFHTLRMIMNGNMSATRLTAMLAGFGIAMMVTGALGKQLRNVINGREPEAMDNPQFWLLSAASGGVFNVWGGFISGLADSDADFVKAQLAGPILGGVADIGAAGAETFSQMIGLSDNTGGMRHLVEAVERNLGPKPFYAAAVLSREVYERLKELSDPVGYKRSVSTRIRNAKKRGQVYVPGWKPSDRPITEALGF